MSQTCHFTCFLTFLPFKCHKLLMAHEDLGCELRVSRSRRAPLFSPFRSQRAGKLSVGPLGRPSPNMRCTSLNTTAPLCSTHTQPRQAKAQPPDADACCREGSHSPCQLGRAPRISPSRLQATRTDVTLKTGRLALLLLATGSAHFVGKCTSLQNPRVIHLRSQPETPINKRGMILLISLRTVTPGCWWATAHFFCQQWQNVANHIFVLQNSAWTVVGRKGLPASAEDSVRTSEAVS